MRKKEALDKLCTAMTRPNCNVHAVELPTTKTAYAEQLTAAEFVEHTKDMSPEEREEFRLENATNPLFDLWLRFNAAFGDFAIDHLVLSDEDAEAAAKEMEGFGPAGDAFAYLLRSIPSRRRRRAQSGR